MYNISNNYTFLISRWVSKETTEDKELSSQNHDIEIPDKKKTAFIEYAWYFL